MTLREQIVAEAKTWERTPWKHGACEKGVGVDCGQLLIAVYKSTGILPAELSVSGYAADFMFKDDTEIILPVVMAYCDEVPFVPYLPGDLVLFRYGQSWSHGGIIEDWPYIIHATFPYRMVYRGNAHTVRWPRRIFRPHALKDELI